jgi:hypothetical protein
MARQIFKEYIDSIFVSVMLVWIINNYFKTSQFSDDIQNYSTSPPQHLACAYNIDLSLKNVWIACSNHSNNCSFLRQWTVRKIYWSSVLIDRRICLTRGTSEIREVPGVRGFIAFVANKTTLLLSRKHLRCLKKTTKETKENTKNTKITKTL